MIIIVYMVFNQSLYGLRLYILLSIGSPHTCQHLSSKIREISAVAVGGEFCGGHGWQRRANVGFEGCYAYKYL